MNVVMKVVAVLLVVAAGAWAYYANVASGRPAMDMNMRITSGNTPFPVTLAPIERGRITGGVTYTGSVAAFNEEDIYPRVTGRIVSMPVYPGDRVEAGQVVAKLDDIELGSKVREAAAGVAAAEANLAQMEADVLVARQGIIQMEKELAMAEAEAGYQQSVAARDERLLARGAIAQQEAENSRAMATAARAKVEAARAKVEAAKAMEASALKKREAMKAMATQSQAMLRTNEVVRDYVNIRAPSNAYVVKRLVAPGVLVQPGMAILKIAQIDKVRLQANVGEKDLPSIRVGSPVLVTTAKAEGPPITARVTSVFPFVDQGSRTAVVEAVVENTGRRFLPGQYVQMQFVTGERADALSVPRGAVARLGGKATVWVVREDKGEPVEVTTGLENSERVEITKGLDGTERVIARGHEGLYAGARVSQVGDAVPAGPGGEEQKGMPGMPEAKVSAPPAAPAHDAGHGTETKVAQAPGAARGAGDLKINLTTTPSPPKVGENRLRIEVKDAAGAPVSNANVEVNTGMAGMPGPKLTARAAKDPGIYEATANLGMAGAWTIEVAVAHPQGGTKSAKFNLDAK